MAASKSKQSKCPICDDATDARYRPFCSKRCADVDLGRWLGGGYAIAGRDDDDDVAPAVSSAGPRGLNGNRDSVAPEGDAADNAPDNDS